MGFEYKICYYFGTVMSVEEESAKEFKQRNVKVEWGFDISLCSLNRNATILVKRSI